VVFDQDRCERATQDAFRAAIATGWLDIGRIIWIDFDDGARITGQTSVTWIAILAEIPVDDR